jgi:hypothetical protein
VAHLLIQSLAMRCGYRDRALAASVTRHFQVLIERSPLGPLPKV